MEAKKWIADILAKNFPPNYYKVMDASGIGGRAFYYRQSGD
jgi:hypothetical protein